MSRRMQIVDAAWWELRFMAARESTALEMVCSFSFLGLEIALEACAREARHLRTA
jgi:hypothetical protein